MEWVNEIAVVYNEKKTGAIKDESDIRVSVHRLRSDGFAFQVIRTLRTSIECKNRSLKMVRELWARFLDEESALPTQTEEEFVESCEMFRRDKNGAYL